MSFGSAKFNLPATAGATLAPVVEYLKANGSATAGKLATLDLNKLWGKPIESFGKAAGPRGLK